MIVVKLLPARDRGTGLNPFNALMALNDLRALRSKIDLMSQSAMRVAEFLEEHAAVADVLYRGLPAFAGHSLAVTYMWLADGEDFYGKPTNRFGHRLSFTVAADEQATRRVFDQLELVFRVTDLGRIKSVAAIPAISTHQQQGEGGGTSLWCRQTLVRLCVGAESCVDIIDNLDRALAAVS